MLSPFLFVSIFPPFCPLSSSSPSLSSLLCPKSNSSLSPFRFLFPSKILAAAIHALASASTFCTVVSAKTLPFPRDSTFWKNYLVSSSFPRFHSHPQIRSLSLSLSLLLSLWASFLLRPNASVSFVGVPFFLFEAIVLSVRWSLPLSAASRLPGRFKGPPFWEDLADGYAVEWRGSTACFERSKIPSIEAWERSDGSLNFKGTISRHRWLPSLRIFPTTEPKGESRLVSARFKNRLSIPTDKAQTPTKGLQEPNKFHSHPVHLARNTRLLIPRDEDLHRGW